MVSSDTEQPCKPLFDHIFFVRFYEYMTSSTPVQAPGCTLDAMQAYFTDPVQGLRLALNVLLNVPSHTDVMVPDPNNGHRKNAGRRPLEECSMKTWWAVSVLRGKENLKKKDIETLRSCSIDLFEQFESVSVPREQKIYTLFGATYLTYLEHWKRDEAQVLAHFVYMATQGAYDSVRFTSIPQCDSELDWSDPRQALLIDQ